MRTFASTAVIIVALACCACNGGASTARQPETQASLTLPPQFAGSWKVDAHCPKSATGLDVDDTIEIEQRAGLKITLANTTSRTPDPLLLENPTLTIVNPDDATGQNVLTAAEAEVLCKADPDDFGEKFWEVLMDHNFKLTYLAGAGPLDSTHPHIAQLVFLTYVIEGEESKPQFLLAVVDPGHRPLHNGIVHGHP